MVRYDVYLNSICKYCDISDFSFFFLVKPCVVCYHITTKGRMLFALYELHHGVCISSNSIPDEYIRKLLLAH